MYSTIVVMYYGESPEPNWITKFEAAGAGVLDVKVCRTGVSNYRTKLLLYRH